MILAYALGGGLGHVTRVRALAATLGWDEPLTIITSNPHAADPRVRGDAQVHVAPVGVARDPHGLEELVRTTAAASAPARVLVDTFPCGILHELRPDTFGAGTEVVHVGRALRWSAYAPGALPVGLRFAVAYVVEPIGAVQRAFLGSVAATVVDLELREVAEPARGPDGRVVERIDQDATGAEHRPLWLVVHSGPDHETLELVAYAHDVAAAAGDEARVVVVTRERPAALDPQVGHLDVQPAWPLFATADRIFAAAGSNVVRQLAAHASRTSLLPFDRRFDDQYERARRFADRP